MVMVMVCGEWMGVWWWLLLSGLSENGCKHIGNSTAVDEVMATDTHALSFEIVCSGQLQSFLELAVILKKQINKKKQHLQEKRGVMGGKGPPPPQKV